MGPLAMVPHDEGRTVLDMHIQAAKIPNSKSWNGMEVDRSRDKG